MRNVMSRLRAIPLPISSILVCCVALSMTYNLLIPLGKGPDENKHYAYIQHLVLYRDLPVLKPGSHVDERPPHALGIHPPLYYGLLAPFYAALRSWMPDAAIQHFFRFFALLMGLGSLWFWYRTMRLLFPEDTSLVRATFAFIALLPHFLLLSTTMNNDNLLILLSSALFYTITNCLLGRFDTQKSLIAIGLLFNAMLLTKASVLVLTPVVLMVALLAARRGAGKRGTPLMNLALVLALSSFPSVLWYRRFLALYKRVMPVEIWPDLLWSNSWHEFWTSRCPPDCEHRLLGLGASGTLNRPGPLWLLGRYVWGIQKSLWAQVDWFYPERQREVHLVVPKQTPFGPIDTIVEVGFDDEMLNSALYRLSLVIFAALTLLTVVALFGLMLRFVRSVRRWRAAGCPALSNQALALGVLITVFLLLYAALGHYTLFTHPGGYEGGRYLLPTVGVYSLLFYLGLTPWLKGRWRIGTYVLVPLLLFLLNLCCVGNLVLYLIPVHSGS